MTDIPVETADAAAPVRLSLRAFTARPLTLVSLIVVVIVVASVFGARILAPAGPYLQDLIRPLEGPTAAHVFGTDALGRDILSRLLYGGQPALLGVAVALVVYAVLGMILGILAGYLGGWTDRVISAVLDLMLSIPGIVMILAVLAIFSQNVLAAMVVLGLLSSANLARVIRASCLALRDELFVAAATVSGLSSLRIMFRHILPGLIGQLVVQSSLFAGIALAVQTGLGFLGLATPAPAPSWGGMVGEASQVISTDGFFLLVTGGTIAIMTIAFGLIGDGLRDATSDRRGKAAPLARKSADDTSEPVAPARRPRTDAVLDVSNLSVGFTAADGSVKEIVKHVSFGVAEGEIFGLVGESGSGKTVTGLSLIGLLPSNGRVTGGHAWIGVDDLATLPQKQLASRIRGREIGLVSQEPMVALDPLFTIGFQLSEVIGRIGGVERKQIPARALELLASVRLHNPEAVMRSYPHELSGGMLQRVAIALALTGSPRLLIADEPTTALDVTVQASILDLLRDLRDRLGMAIILITHDLAVVADICDRAIVMSQGEIVEEASIDDLFYNPQDGYTKMLISQTPTVARTP
jgi:peptide/nickel transport system permease protein